MKNLAKYFKNKRYDPTNWKSYPIILGWMNLERMKDELKIIDSKVEYLLKNSRSKVREWFSNDNALTQITAERYILDYLRKINTNYIENFTGGGVDAYLEVSGERIGIEVTTINNSTPEWVFHERLLMYLDTKSYSGTDAIEISYPEERVVGVRYSLNMIEQVGNRIIEREYGSVDSVSIKKLGNTGSYISWNQIVQPYNLFTALEEGLRNIVISKRSQLMINDKNILFVGVNQLPSNELNPSIFREAANPGRFKDEILFIEQAVERTLPNYVSGVCFFIYTLNSNEPMYPLKIFWKDKSHKIKVNL